MSFPEAQRSVLASGIELDVHEQGSGPAVVLCHGFPELAFSWRHQLPALAEAGFRAIAPDQRGYGGSSKPEKVEDYGLEALAADLRDLLDALGIERAVFAGHDWGGFVAWAMPLLYPERTAGVIGVNTPYVPFPSTELLRGMVGGDDERLYILWFQKPGVAEAVLDRTPRLVFEKLMRGGAPVEGGGMLSEGSDGAPPDANPFRRLEALESNAPAILSEAEIDTYARAFEAGGFFGPVSWYRNIDRNAERVPGIGVQKLELPCLMITAEWDGALRPQMAAGMPALCSDLETHQIAECGHWTQQEKPEELNRVMVDWLRRRFT
jgi:pimeloyl-ACP methyl ester carboxylesterase